MEKPTVKRVIRSLYKYGPRPEGLKFPNHDKDGRPLSGRTKQAFKDECDINTILKKFERTGILPGSEKTPRYGDFSDMTTYQEALHIVQQANEQFAGLPARVRERFQNDPARFLDFTQDASNADEMAKMGLMKPEAIERVQKAKESKKSPKKDPSPEGSDK